MTSRIPEHSSTWLVDWSPVIHHGQHDAAARPERR